MKEIEMQRTVLQKLYHRKDDGWLSLRAFLSEPDLRENSTLRSNFNRICQRLKEKGFLQGTPDVQGQFVVGRITSAGREEFEKTENPSMSVHIDQSKTYNQFGNGNTQNIDSNVWKDVTLGQIAEAIKGTPDGPEKEDAKNLFTKILENPTVASVLGGLASGLPAAL